MRRGLRAVWVIAAFSPSTAYTGGWFVHKMICGDGLRTVEHESGPFIYISWFAYLRGWSAFLATTETNNSHSSHIIQPLLRTSLFILFFNNARMCLLPTASSAESLTSHAKLMTLWSPTSGLKPQFLTLVAPGLRLITLQSLSFVNRNGWAYVALPAASSRGIESGSHERVHTGCCYLSSRWVHRAGP